jgi:hypothetical protein
MEMPGRGGSDDVVASSARMVRLPVEYALASTVPSAISESKRGVSTVSPRGCNDARKIDPRLSSRTTTTLRRDSGTAETTRRSVGRSGLHAAPPSATESPTTNDRMRADSSATGRVAYNPSYGASCPLKAIQKV